MHLSRCIFQGMYDVRKRHVESKGGVLPVSIGLSHTDVRCSGVVYHCIGVIRRGNVPFSSIPVRLARATTLCGSQVDGLVRGVISTKFRLRVSSFNSNCSSVADLGRLPFSALGLSGDLVSCVRGFHKRRIVHRAVSLTRDLKVGILTRNIRGTGRIRVLQDLDYSRVRNFCCTQPLP